MFVVVPTGELFELEINAIDGEHRLAGLRA